MERRAEMTDLTHEFAVIDNNELNANTGKFIIYDKKLLKSITYIYDDILCLFIDKLKNIIMPSISNMELKVYFLFIFLLLFTSRTFNIYVNVLTN